MSDLKSRLVRCAGLWAEAHGDERGPAPLSRLGKQVAGDANFFDRIAAGGGLNLATLEKFAACLIDPANWPDGVVPEEARGFAHAVGVPLGATPENADRPAEAAESAGKCGDLSRQSDQKDAA